MEDIVKYVLGIRQVPAARASLRRAGSSTTEHYAYGYLSPYWAENPTRKNAVLAFAGLSVETLNIKQDSNVSIGALVADLVLSEKMKEANAARKLTIMQNASLEQMKTIIRSFLRPADTSGFSLDYNDLYWLLALSENKDRTKRIKSRRKVLESFYHRLDGKRNKETEYPKTNESLGTEVITKEKQ